MSCNKHDAEHGKCRGCLWGRPYREPQMLADDPRKLVCHRYPPAPILVPMGPNAAQLVFQPPVVDPNFGCGEFKPELIA